MFLRRLSTILFLWMVSHAAFAAAPNWIIDLDKSNITFTAIQNNSPVQGHFKTFTGEINFDPDQLKTSRVLIKVDIGSVSTSYKDVEETLRTPDWFDVNVFPQAIFRATQFRKIDSKNFEAIGTLTLRDKTLPIKLAFTLDEYAPPLAKIHGSTNLQRTVFGIGRGEWTKTDDIKDDVKVEFNITAKTK